MIELITTILQQNCFIDLRKKALIGVSGGPDSLCLLDVLHQAGLPLVVAHLDHGLRPDSAADAETVRDFAAQRGLPCVISRVDVAGFASQQALSLEEAGRILRYRFLFRQAEEHGAQAVAVAHTADDQVETALMHLLRGSGLAGLRGMAFRALPNPWSSRIPLVRPLLSSWRDEILQYCREHELHPLMDESNQDTAFYRNRVRHELVPYLQGYNPEIKRALWRTALLLAGDYALIESMVEDAWQECLAEVGQDHLVFSRQALLDQELPVQRYLLRKGISQLRSGLRDIEFETIERAIAFLNLPSQARQMDLAAGLRLLLEGDRLFLADWRAALPGAAWPQISPEVLAVDLPGSLSLPDGWKLDAEVLQPGSPALGLLLADPEANADPFQVWLDLDCLHQPLLVRRRRPGDRIKPLGMGGKSVKISDLMINARVPARLRSAWPLVCAGEEVIWAPGLHSSETSRVKDDTSRAVHLRLHTV